MLLAEAGKKVYVCIGVGMSREAGRREGENGNGREAGRREGGRKQRRSEGMRGAEEE